MTRRAQTKLFVSVLAVGLFLFREAWAVPYSATSTTRESVKITALGSFGTPPTYAQLSGPSSDLSFQITSDGRIFAVFATTDSSVDNLSYPLEDRCTDGVQRIYWVDRASAKPAVCVSPLNTDPQYAGMEVSIINASSRPLVGGPESLGDEGRYVLFESWAPELTASTPPNIDLVDRQLIVHDRKWEKTFLATAQTPCDGPPTTLDPIPTLVPLPSDITVGTSLHQLSDDGATALFTSSHSTIINNLLPQCGDPNGGVTDVYVRDGKTCDQGAIGPCKTSVLYDRYGYHAGTSVVDLLNDYSFSAYQTPDGATTVVDTLTTVPVQFLPDPLGFRDIFLHESEAFTLMSQSQLVTFNINTGQYQAVNFGGPANADSANPRIDSSGKYFVFESLATDLVLEQVGTGIPPVYQPVATNGYRHIYLYNRYTNSASMITSGANGNSEDPWISRDARCEVFESGATNLMQGITTTAVRNIFLHDRARNLNYLVTTGFGDTGLSADAHITFVSPNGLTVAYETTANDASNLTPSGTTLADTNGVKDVFLAVNDCPDDSDGDGTPDCLDLCSEDPNKTEPGQCGCGVADTDTDGDGTSDCNDQCSTSPIKTTPGQCGCTVEDTDTDGDGTADCVDGCPYTSTKASPGACGCSLPDVDNNQNGNADCIDPAADYVPAKAKVKLLKLPKNVTKPRARVTATYDFPGANLKVEFTLARVGSSAKPKIATTSKKQVTFKNLTQGAKYSVTYKLVAGIQTTKSSPAETFKAKNGRK